MRDHQDTQSTSPGTTSARLVVSVLAACGAVFIAAEPLIFQTTPSMQIFQGTLVFLFWAIVMFGSTPEPPTS